MNHFLASIVGFLNGLLALILIIGGAAIGSTLEDQFDINGVVIGLIVGIILAVVVCGLLAIFISMRNELIAIRRLLADGFVVDEQSEAASSE